MGVRVRQRKDRPGWWLIIDHLKKRRKKHFADKETALRVAKRVRERLALGDFSIVEDKPRPFRDYYRNWLETYVRNNTKEATYASYELAYRAHLLPFFQDTGVHQITREQVKEFMYTLLNAGLARNSVKGYLAPLREMFNHAIEDGHVDQNPCLRIIRHMRSEHGERQERINFLTRAEVTVLLDTYQHYAPADYPFVLLLVRTGLRLGEAVALQWADIDFNPRVIQVRRNLSLGRIQTPKSGKWRRVDMSKHLTETLKNLQHELRKETLKRGWREMPEWVFTSHEGTRMDSNNFRHRVWRKVIAKAGFRHILLKDLRHTFASLLIQQGESLAYVKEQMGHHSIQVTVDIYGHLVPGGNKAAVDRLDEPAPPSSDLDGPGRTLYGPTAPVSQPLKKRK